MFEAIARFVSNTYDRIIIGLLVVQYVFVNLIFTTYTQNIVLLKDLSAPLLSMVILFFWIMGDMGRYGTWKLPRHGIVPSTVAALLFWIIPVVAGKSTASGVETWGRMACYFIQVWAVIRFMDSYARVGIFLRMVLVTNVLIVGYGLTQIMGRDLLVELGWIPDWGSYVFVSTHGNPNFLAGYLITTYPTLIGYWLITRNPLLIVALPALVLLNLYEIVESTARGAYLASAIYFPILIVALLVNFRNLHVLEDEWRKRFFKAAAVLLVVALIAGGIFATAKLTSITETVVQQFYSLVEFEGNYTNFVRLVFFQMALDGARREPWIGRGIGSFNWLMPETRPIWYHRTGVSHNTDHPHNEHLEWLHDSGLLGLAFFWWILFSYFWTGVREVRRHRKGYHYPLIMSAMMGPWMQWVQGTFDVETRWTGNGVTMWFTLGFVLAFCNLPVILRREEMDAATAVKPVAQAGKGKRGPVRAAQNQPLWNPSPYLPYATAFMALVIVFYVVKARDFWMADHHLRNNMAFTDGGGGPGLQRALQEAEAARELSYATTSNYYKLAYTYLMANRLNDAMAAYRDLQSFAPNYAQIHINLAFLNDQMGYRPTSAWERSRASAIEHNTRNNRDAAQYWLQMGYPNRAIGHLRKCFTFERDRLESGYFYWYDIDNIYTDLARIYASVGRNAMAEKALTQALQFNPGNMSSALTLQELYAQMGATAAADSLAVMLERHAPASPALAAIKMKKALAINDLATALDLADQISAGMPLPPPGAQISQDVSMLGNSILSVLQSAFSKNFQQARCLDIAGWVYACQGRYGEAQAFLNQSYAATRSPRTAQRLGEVRARQQ